MFSESQINLVCVKLHSIIVMSHDTENQKKKLYTEELMLLL